MNPGIPVAIGAPSRPMEPRVRPVTRARREPTPPAVKYMYVVWAIVLFDPHRLLASIGPGIFARTMTFTFMALLVMIALEAPAALSSRRGVWIVFPLMGAFIANALVSSFFALNRGTAWENTQPFIIYYVLGVGTFFFVKNARQLLPIIYMLCFYQFLWWEINARAAGVVWVAAILAASVGANAIASNLRDFEPGVERYGEVVALRAARTIASVGVGLCALAPAPAGSILAVPLSTLAALALFQSTERFGLFVVDGALLLGALITVAITRS